MQTYRLGGKGGGREEGREGGRDGEFDVPGLNSPPPPLSLSYSPLLLPSLTPLSSLT